MRNRAGKEGTVHWGQGAASTGQRVVIPVKWWWLI